MIKRGISLLMVLIFLFVFFACSPQSNDKLNILLEEHSDLVGKVQYVSKEDNDGYDVIYEEIYYNQSHLFQVREDSREIPENDILIAWDTLPFGLWYLDEYYSYTADAPIFFYLSRTNDVFIRDDYNYETDVFVIEGTEQKFVFSDMFTSSNAIPYAYPIPNKDGTDITLYSETCPRLQIPLRLFCENDIWYAGGISQSALFEVSDELLDTLIIDIR